MGSTTIVISHSDFVAKPTLNPQIVIADGAGVRS